MRSVFSAGLLDGFLQRRFNPFDGYIGVSAGAGNLAGFLAGAEGKSLELFLRMARSISPLRFARGGPLIDLRTLLDAIAASGLDIANVYRHGKPLFVVTTDVATGQAVYVDTAADTLMQVLAASMALPLMVRDLPFIAGRMMADGGMADAIPVREAMRRGAKTIMVVRSRPDGYVKRDTPAHRYIRWRLRTHPQLRRAMKGRVRRHDDAVALLHSPPTGVHIVDVCPPPDFCMGRFSTRRRTLLHGYGLGLSMADRVIAQWHRATA